MANATHNSSDHIRPAVDWLVLSTATRSTSAGGRSDPAVPVDSQWARARRWIERCAPAGIAAVARRYRPAGTAESQAEAVRIASQLRDALIACRTPDSVLIAEQCVGQIAGRDWELSRFPALEPAEAPLAWNDVYSPWHTEAVAPPELLRWSYEQLAVARFWGDVWHTDELAPRELAYAWDRLRRIPLQLHLACLALDEDPVVAELWPSAVSALGQATADLNRNIAWLRLPTDPAACEFRDGRYVPSLDPQTGGPLTVRQVVEQHLQASSHKPAGWHALPNRPARRVA
ncbi:MAG: hypothetical protein J5I93_16050 [Pirellulaceae bacterium]|nr:hypothetical protein [Pirellulaceae bacterium]